MASIEVRGYVNKPQVKTGSKGDFSTFTLSEKIKKPDGSHERAFYNVAWFDSPTPPEEGSYVTVKGYLKPRTFEQNGVKRLSNDITCKELEVSPGREPAAKATPAAPAGDPWDL